MIRWRAPGMLEAMLCLLVATSVLLPLAFVTGWIRSIIFVNVLSICALQVTAIVGVVSALADRKNPQTD